MKPMHQSEASIFSIEPLEGRQLFCGIGGSSSSITFALAPAAVQTGLETLATNDGLTAPTDTQAVKLGNRNGVETYTIKLTSAGVTTQLTVDQNGDPVVAPVKTTETFADLGTANPAAAAEITAIAAALNLTAPATDTVVNVVTANGKSTFSVKLAPTDPEAEHSRSITVDEAGNPVGNQRLPLSVFSTAIRDALVANTPAGADALTDASLIRVQTIDGVTLYSATFTATGIKTTVTVNAAGVLTSLPTHSTTTFDQLSAAVAAELQTLATAKGATDPIAAATSIDVLTEPDGTKLYSIKVSVTTTDTDGDTHTRRYLITVDSDGNPTVLPGGGFGEESHGFGGHEGFGFRRRH